MNLLLVGMFLPPSFSLSLVQAVRHGNASFDLSFFLADGEPIRENASSDTTSQLPNLPHIRTFGAPAPLPTLTSPSSSSKDQRIVPRMSNHRAVEVAVQVADELHGKRDDLPTPERRERPKELHWSVCFAPEVRSGSGEESKRKERNARTTPHQLVLHNHHLSHHTQDVQPHSPGEEEIP